MNVLLIDTSTRTARVGLLQDEKLVDVKEWESTPSLGKDLVVVIDELLKRHHLELKDVKRVAVHRGKAGSSFMALRTGIVTGTTFAESLGAELVQVEGDSLDTIVEQACQGEAILTVEPNYLP